MGAEGGQTRRELKSCCRAEGVIQDPGRRLRVPWRIDRGRVEHGRKVIHSPRMGRSLEGAREMGRSLG